MIDRILEIADTSAFLKIRNGLLKVYIDKLEKASIPLEDIGVLLLSNPAITVTQPVLAELTSVGSIVVIVGKNHYPAGMILPLASQHSSSGILETQVNATVPMMKQAWKQIVQAKIQSQANLLLSLHHDDAGLSAMTTRIHSGDPENLEAQAARRYWGKLFGNTYFRRDRNASDANALLNYGYMVLRAMVCRYICAAGLHPALGIHHHNSYDPFCLASDLMEPFRIVIDKAVADICKTNTENVKLTKETRQQILKPLTEFVLLEGDVTQLGFAVKRLAVSLRQLYEGKQKKLLLPDQYHL